MSEETVFGQINREIESGKYLVSFLPDAGVAGTQCAILIHNDYPMPLGFVWFRALSMNTLQLIHSHVVEECDRVSIRTAIHEELKKYYKYQVTNPGGKKETEDLLKRIGFVSDEYGFLRFTNTED